MNSRVLAVLSLLALGLGGCGGGTHSTASTETVSETTPTATGATPDTSTRGSSTSSSTESGANAAAGSRGSQSGGAGASANKAKHAATAGGEHSSKSTHGGPKVNENAGSTTSPVAHPTRPGVAAKGSGSPSANATTGVPYAVSTHSMSPTYEPGTKVYYDPTRSTPQVGDVILFYLAEGATEGVCGTVEAGGEACREPGSSALTQTISIKRVVGVGGDRIAMHDGLVIRNGETSSEPYATACEGAGCEYPKAITVPAGSYYVLSDDRQLFQADSRVFGAVRKGAIVGTVEGG